MDRIVRSQDSRGSSTSPTSRSLDVTLLADGRCSALHLRVCDRASFWSTGCLRADASIWYPRPARWPKCIACFALRAPYGNVPGDYDVLWFWDVCGLIKENDDSNLYVTKIVLIWMAIDISDHVEMEEFVILINHIHYKINTKYRMNWLMNYSNV